MPLSSRYAFMSWLRHRAGSTDQETLRNRIRSYGRRISTATAYRAAVDLRLLGHRVNASRYDRFWSELDWRLPNAVLASIWRVHRSNVRARRLRLGIGAPDWDAEAHRDLAAYRRAVASEERKAEDFDGPRPDPAQRRQRGAKAVQR